jgi:hypothetical protein
LSDNQVMVAIHTRHIEAETAIKGDKFLVLAHGTADEVTRAQDIIRTTHPSEVASHELKTREAVGATA